MALERLSLRDFRCFGTVDLQFSPHNNLVIGANASGKTSLLEAVYFLSRGRSFRTAQQLALVRDGERRFQVVGHIGAAVLGIERSADGTTARLNGTPAPSRAAMAETLPVQMIDARSHLLIEGGPSNRRRFLDWGAFHVEHSFWSAWRRYHRCLKQRNALLRSHAERRLLESWTAEMVDSGLALDASRQSYFERWQPIALAMATQILDLSKVELIYRRGWPQHQSLEESFLRSMDRDRKSVTTQTGPHRAEFLIEVGQSPARARISRGQQKALAAALLLAQAVLHAAFLHRPCTLLVDDPAAELDTTHLSRFGELLRKIDAQKIFTAITADASPAILGEEDVMFHVKQSRVEVVV